MKSVLISIQPQWCELIASGRKTIEVRKTRPKLDTPFKVYIYETLGKKVWTDIPIPEEQGGGELRDLVRKGGMVIGEFVCDCIDEYEAEFVEDDCLNAISRITTDDDGEKDFRYETSNERENPNDCELCRQSGLTFEEIRKYVGYSEFGVFYGWHISDLKIYDNPRRLIEFFRYCTEKDDCYKCNHRDTSYDNTYYDAPSDFSPCRTGDKKHFTRPPQSWCYVEDEI